MNREAGKSMRAASAAQGGVLPAARGGAAIAALVLCALAPATAFGQMYFHAQAGSKVDDVVVPKGSQLRLYSAEAVPGLVFAGGDLQVETADMALSVKLSGAAPSSASARQINERVAYVLHPPESARFDGGKIVVFGYATGRLQPNAVMNFRLSI